jgi:hypothetical protein
VNRLGAEARGQPTLQAHSARADAIAIHPTTKVRPTEASKQALARSEKGKAGEQTRQAHSHAPLPVERGTRDAGNQIISGQTTSSSYQQPTEGTIHGTKEHRQLPLKGKEQTATRQLIPGASLLHSNPEMAERQSILSKLQIAVEICSSIEENPAEEQHNATFPGLAPSSLDVELGSLTWNGHSWIRRRGRWARPLPSWLGLRLSRLNQWSRDLLTALSFRYTVVGGYGERLRRIFVR